MMEIENHFLVLHKVRGIPQLDIACRDHAGEYICCTGGYKAEPWWTLPLKDIVDLLGPFPEMPEDAVDVWQVLENRLASGKKAKDLPSVDVLALLGIAKPQAVPSDFKRRI